MKRTGLFAFIGLIFLALVGYGAPVFAQKPAIKIGVADDFTAGLAAQGRDLLQSVKMFLAEKGWNVAGRKIELVSEDTKLDPTTALTKTKKMVLDDKVHFLIGYHSSGDVLAIRDYVHQQGIPLLSAGGAVELSRELKSPYIFRVMSANVQYGYPLGVYAAKQGYKKAILMGIDYVAAHQAGSVVKAGFEEKGGKVIDQAWTRWGTTDFSPYLAKIAGKKGEVDVLLTCYWGPEAGRFFAQYDEYGLKGVIPVCAAGGVDETALPGVGKHGIGIRHLYVYAATIDTPKNKKYVEAFEKEMGRMPGGFGFIGYNSAWMAWNALEKINGEVENTSKFLDALRKTDFKNELTGSRLHFDERQAIILDHYVMEIREVKGKIVNVVIETVPQVEDPVNKFPMEFFKR